MAEKVLDSLPVDAVIAVVQEPLLILDAGLIISAVNPTFCRLFQLSGPDIRGQHIYSLAHQRWNVAQLSTLLEEELPVAHQVNGFALDVTLDAGTSRSLQVNACRMGDPPLILLTFRPASAKVGAPTGITEHKTIESLIQDRALRQAVIAELGQQALKGVEPSVLMQHAVSQAATVLEVEYCKVLELLPGGDELLLRAGVGWQPAYAVNEAKVSAGSNSQAGFTLLSHEPVVVYDLRQETRFRGPPLLEAHQVISGMSVVIGGHQAPYGVLGAHTTQRRSFSADQVNFLQSIANLLAMAIERRRAETQQAHLLAEVRRAHAEAEHERKRLYDFFMNVPAAVCVLQGPDHVYQLANPAHCALSNNRHLIGRSVCEAHPHIEEGHLALLDQVYQTGKPLIGKEMHVVFYSQDGDLVAENRVNYIFHPIVDANGEVTGIFVHGVDVTDHVHARRQIEALAAEREGNLARLRAIFDSVAEGLLIADPQGFLLEMNPAGLALHGIENVQDAHLHLSEYAHLFELYTLEGELIPLERWPLSRVLRQETFRAYEVRVKDRNTGDEWIGNYSGSPVYDSDGNFIFAVLIVSNVTEKRQAAHALLESEARFRGTFENAAVGISHVSTDGNWLRVNQRLCEIIGHSETELLSGMTFQEITHPEDLALDLEYLDQLIRGEIQKYQMEKRYFHKRGHIVWVQLTVALQRQENGEPLYCIAVIEDISERKQAEQALSEARRQQAELLSLLESSLDNAPVGFAFFDREHRYTRINKMLASHHGLSVDEHLGRKPSEIQPETAQRFDPLIDEVFAYRQAIQNLEIPAAAQGDPATLTHWLASLYPVVDQNDRALYVGLVLIDITDRKRAEEALRQSETRFRVMAESLPDILFTCQPNGSIDYINRRFRGYTGIQPEGVLGTQWTKVIHREDVQRHRQEWQRALRHGLSFENEFRLRTTSDQYRWFMGRAHPIHDDQGGVVRWIGTCTDIHDQKLGQEALRQSEQQLRVFNETLEERVQQRTRQVRELASALTLAEQRERRRVSQILHDHVQQMLYGIQMRNHLLKLDSSMNDQAAVNEHIRVMDELVEQAIRSTRSLSVELSPPVLNNEGLAAAFEWLASNMREVHALTVETDFLSDFQPASEDLRVLIFQVTRELLFNVVKHANTHVARLEMYEKGADIFVRVIDEGSGFELTRIEEKERQPGDGFGLYSIQERLALFGGHLVIESTLKRGTIATIAVPRQPTMPSWQRPFASTQS